MSERVNRRRHERYPCDRDLDGQLAGKEAATFPCHAVNASEGGMMIEVTRALETGQKIELYLRSRDRSRSFVAEAEVRWCQPHGQGFRCGVMFLSRREDYVI